MAEYNVQAKIMAVMLFFSYKTVFNETFIKLTYLYNYYFVIRSSFQFEYFKNYHFLAVLLLIIIFIFQI